jgi:two-component system osmolarity sensor histidine kinase EnvZ
VSTTSLKAGAASRRGWRLLGWIKSGLFWRTFFLLSVLTALSMASWIGMLSVFQRGSQAEQTSELLVSVVTITKAALTHSAPDLRLELLMELVSNEGIRILTLEPTDKVEPPTTCRASGSASTSTATSTG